MYAHVEKTTCTDPLPAVTAAKFSALFDRCMVSGLKARWDISHAAGCQVINVSCSLPVTAETTPPQLGGAAAVVIAVDGMDALPPLSVQLPLNHPLRSLSLQLAETYRHQQQYDRLPHHCLPFFA
jgi:hypothetical protein